MYARVFVSLIGIAALGVGCAQILGIEDLPPRPDASTPDASAPDAGETLERFANVDKFMEDSIAANRFVGGVAIVYQEGGESYTKTFGVKDIVSGDPMPEDGLFRLVSLGKTVYSVAAMSLYEEGKFDLQDPISQYLPEWANQKKLVVADPEKPEEYEVVDVENEITIHHLLTHTSGLIFKFFGWEPISAILQEAGVLDGLNLAMTDHTLESFSALLAAQPLLHEPGANWTYGPNPEVMARIMEVVEGKPFIDIMKERVFGPLGMDSCGYFFEEEDIARFVPIHTFNPANGEVIIFPDTTLSFGQPGAPAYWDINPTYPYNPETPKTFTSPSEGLVCSPQDFLKFTRMILNKGELNGVRVLKEETVELMTSNQIGEELHAQGNDDYDFGYGFGINMGPNRFNGRQGPAGELDWGGYFNTFFTVDYTNKLITIIFTQTFVGPDFSLQLDFKDAVYKAVGIYNQ